MASIIELEQMNLLRARIGHNTAPVVLREELAVRPALFRFFGCHLRLAGNLAEVVPPFTSSRAKRQLPSVIN
jgi:hypothetical protein